MASNPIPFSAEIESVRASLKDSRAAEDFRALAEGLVNAIARINPNALQLTAVGTNPGQAVPAGVTLKVTGANGVFTLAIDDGSQNGKPVWKEISYSKIKSFSRDVTQLPITTATSITVPDPDGTYFFRMRVSFDRVNWSSYQLAQASQVRAGLVSSAATAAGASFAQTNYGVVSSVAAGSSADVEIAGANGGLTSLVAVKGGAQSVLPSATIVGVTPGSTQFVGWNGKSYVLRPTLASVLSDDLTPIGSVSVVGVGAPTLPVVSPVIAGGGVVGFNVVSGGNGASGPYDITINGKGIGATAGQQTIQNGVLISIAPGNPGGGYDGSTTVTLSGGVASGVAGGGTAAGTTAGRLTNLPDGGVGTTSSGGVAPPSGPANEVYATPDGVAGSATLRALVPGDLPLATNLAVGAVKPDGTTITVDGTGKITAAGAALTGPANEVYATPSGAAGAAALRALVSADLPAATTAAKGAVQPDGTSVSVDVTGKISVASLVIGFVLGSGAVGTNVGPEIAAARAGSLNRVIVVTKTSDAAIAFQFDIKKNGVSIFTGTLPTVAGGTPAGTVSVFTTLTAVPLPVAQHDVFTIDVIQGSANWAVTVQAEN